MKTAGCGVSFGTGSPTPIDWTAIGGVGGTGLIPGRPDDHWGIGYFYYNISEEFRDSIRQSRYMGDLTPASDDDHDGLPDAWEIEHGLSPSNPNDANIDSDGDGHTNLQEYIAGTDPMLESSDRTDSFPGSAATLLQSRRDTGRDRLGCVESGR